MNKLSRKFICGITVILAFSCLCTVLFHIRFLEKYYLYQKKNAITSICSKLTASIEQGISAAHAVTELEASDKVIIATIANNSLLDNDRINDELRTAFADKGIGFQKYWLWEQDYKEILDGETKIRLYKQEKLNYSLLIEYTQIGTELFAVTMIIPNIADAFDIINQFLVFVNIASIAVAIIFIILFITKITKPLQEFKLFAASMEENTFIPLDIRTHDELESVADSLNRMGNRIISYQASLQEKNRQMETLLDNVSHDLKTPISLIRLYTEGMKDGLDDGTFLDTIQSESQKMEEMAERLLYVSRIRKKDMETGTVDLTALIQKLIGEYTILAKEDGIALSSHLENGIMTLTSEDMVTSLFQNLITNAVKYSSGPRIDIILEQTETDIRFIISNETNNTDLDLSLIWTPYYVGEPSRNKKLSGTGLGLTIASTICERLQYSIQCTIDKNKIKFIVCIPKPSVLTHPDFV